MKKLDLTATFKDFEGEELKTTIREGEKPVVMTLKDVLLSYLRNADKMGLTPQEEGVAYELGFILAGQKEATLASEQYDVIKKLCDYGKIKTPQGQELTMFNFIVIKSAKKMVDEAEVVKNKE